MADNKTTKKRDPQDIWKIGLENFDPWKTTYEELNEPMVALRMFDIDAIDPDLRMLQRYKLDYLERCFVQWTAAQDVLKGRGDVEEGPSVNLLWAVNRCLSAGLVAPDWLAKAFRECFEKVDRLETDSWDVAFKKPFQKRGKRKGYKLSALQEARKRNLALYRMVEEASWRGESKGRTAPRRLTDKAGGKEIKGLFERVGEHFVLS